MNRNGTIDPGPAFADVGHTAATGDFLQSKNAFPVYGPYVDSSDSVPGGGTWAPAYTYTSNGIVYNYNNVFDTWYRFFNFDNLARTYDGDAADTSIYYAPAPTGPALEGSGSPTPLTPLATRSIRSIRPTVTSTSAQAPAQTLRP